MYNTNVILKSTFMLTTCQTKSQLCIRIVIRVVICKASNVWLAIN